MARAVLVCKKNTNSIFDLMLLSNYKILALYNILCGVEIRIVVSSFV